MFEIIGTMIESFKQWERNKPEFHVYGFEYLKNQIHVNSKI